MGEDFAYTVTIEKDINIEEIKIPSMFLQILTENAIKHGLKAKPGEKILHIDISNELNGVCVTVADNGVGFDIRNIEEQNGKTAEVVQSLAKWKRYALKKYGFDYGEGLYTDMNAIRRDEDTDNIHSIFVDQWDWEKVIRKEERTLETLKATVQTVFL